METPSIYELHTSEDAKNPREFFMLEGMRVHEIKEQLARIGYDYANKVIGRAELFNKASLIAKTANELAYIAINVYTIILPTAVLAAHKVEEELGRQAKDN